MAWSTATGLDMKRDYLYSNNLYTTFMKQQDLHFILLHILFLHGISITLNVCNTVLL